VNNYQIKSFICIAEQGSFNKASEILFTSKQALVKQIQKLEEELGITLFLRSNKGVILTSAGKKFMEGTKKLSHDFLSLIENCQALSTDNAIIRIGNPPHPRLSLEEAMNKYAIRFPGTKQEIVFFKLYENPVKGLLDNSYDVVSGALKDEYLADGIAYTHMMFQPCQCLMVESNPLAKRKSVSLGDISNYRIGLNRKKPKMNIIAKLEKINPAVNIVECEGDETQFIFNFCFSGGIYISRIFYVETLVPLIVVPLEPNFSEHVVVYYRQNPTGATAEFVKLVEEVYGKNGL
jgi:DNA-binding transcriptional LysR family regulator